MERGYLEKSEIANLAKFSFDRISTLVNAPAAINGIITQIEVALDTLLSRDGVSPNQMTDTLDMNSERIINLPKPVGSHEPARLADLVDLSINVVTSTVPSGFVNVTDYFSTAQKADILTGSPTLDLSAAIQEAENSLDATGGILWFPPGTYRFDSTIFLSSNVHVRGAGVGATVFKPIYNFTMFTNDVLASRDLGNDSTEVTEANQPDHNISFEGVTFDMTATTGNPSPTPIHAADSTTPIRFYYARNVSVRHCEIIGLATPVLSSGKWRGLAGAWVGQGVDGCHFSDNKMHGASVGVDVWQGSKNIWIENNDIVLANNETAHRGNSYCIGVNARGTLATDHKTLENVFIRNNRCTLGGWGTGGIQFDTLSPGSIIKKITISGNVIIGMSGGTNQQGLYCRGVAEDVNVSNNRIEGVQTLPINLTDNFSSGGPWAATDPITTTNGSDLVDVAITGLTSTNVVVGNYLLFNSSATAVGGITFASKYFLVTAVESGVKVTVQADATASSSATGGGSVSVNVWWGSPKRVSILDNILLNCDYANSALVLVQGESVQICNTTAKGGTYGAITFSTSYLRSTQLTPLPSVFGTMGAAGTGITSTSGDNKDNFSSLRNPQTLFPSIVVPHCTDPSSTTTVNGQFWSTTTAFKGRLNGSVYTLVNLEGTQTFTGFKTFAGISFGSTLASSVTDLSKHIALYSTSYGIGITSGRMNFLAQTAHYFNINTVDVASIDESGLRIPGGSLSTKISTQTANYAVTSADSSLIINGAGTVTLTLPAAASRVGHMLRVKTIANQAVNSASANVVPLAGGAAGTAILSNTAGKYALLQSDGTNWIIMEAN